jgi:uncharacterized protein with LGFP repeats
VKADETGLGPSSIPPIQQVYNQPVNGAVLAQPVVFGSTVVVATEADWVYGFNRTTGDVNWALSVGTPEPSSATNCNDVSPSYGVTSTPVVDPSTGLVYVSARTWDGSNANSAQQRIFALNVSTGAIQSGWPVVVAGTASNDHTTAFDASLVNQRTGLLLLDGRIYAAFGSMCDLGDYRGWVDSVSTTTRSQTLWSDEANPGGGDANVQGGIWQAGGGLAVDPDRANSIFFASGNGTAPPVGPGSTASNSVGESVARLQVGSNGTLSLADYFTPFNADPLSAKDQDLGSSAPIMLPDNFGSVPGHPHLTFLGSKQGTGYLLDRDNLGGRAGASGPDNAVAEVNAGATWSHPAAWAGDGGFIYTATGPTGPVKAFHVGVSGSQATLTQAGATADSFSIFSGGPAITSDGTTSGSAVMWVVVRHHNDFTTPDSELRAYNATPSGGTFQQLASFPIGVAAKFSEPATDGGQVFLGTQDGHFLSFSNAPPQCTTYTSPATGSHQVCGAIRAKFLALGGPTGLLGYPTTDETITPDGIGRFNHFSNSGSIYWTPSTGAWSIRGAIRAKWASMGWETSPLGYPVTDETGVPDGVGRFNDFSNSGSIYWTPSTGAWSIHGAIRAKYLALGGPTGFLGYPVTDETGTPDGIGRFNHFSPNHNPNNVDGSIYWTSNTGAWSIHGAIRAKWASLGWESSFGFLGYPTSDETGVPDGVGRFNDFSKSGSIYWTPGTGAWSIHGAIRAKYLSLGGPSSFLGYPVTDESGTPDGVGRFNHFSNSGSIYWTPGTGAWSIRGAIRARWAGMGWERSCLGYPVSDEFAISGGRQSNFQRGFITWNASTGQTTSSC